MQKYKIIQDIPNNILNFGNNFNMYDPCYYKKGMVIEYNEWLGGYCDKLNTYNWRVIIKEFIENNEEYFEKT